MFWNKTRRESDNAALRDLVAQVKALAEIVSTQSAILGGINRGAEAIQERQRWLDNNQPKIGDLTFASMAALHYEETGEVGSINHVKRDTTDDGKDLSIVLAARVKEAGERVARLKSKVTQLEAENKLLRKTVDSLRSDASPTAEPTIADDASPEPQE